MDVKKPPGPREETPWALAISMVMVMESSPAPALVIRPRFPVQGAIWWGLCRFWQVDRLGLKC